LEEIAGHGALRRLAPLEAPAPSRTRRARVGQFVIVQGD